mmetsp:Transcript_87760/g.281834  ORF Transcript_87760/g.281834 Transcript_87760/m.281834 type:complete len:175 (-) Transcript_87760:318-842(-)
MPSQVFVSVTPALRSFLRDCRVTSARKSADDESVDMDEVYRLASEHEKLGGEQVKVHELLEGAEVLNRIPAEAPPMTELEEMRLKSEERKYQRSVQGVAPLYGRKKNEGFDVAGFSFATNFGTQVIVAFIGAFFAGLFFRRDLRISGQQRPQGHRRRGMLVLHAAAGNVPAHGA